jgi:hypothetical protein
MLNAAHFHLVINHAPVIGFAIALIFALIGIFVANRTIHLSAILLTLGSGATGVIAYLTGEPAEEMVTELELGYSGAYLSAHARWGEWTFYAVLAVAALTLALLPLMKQPNGSRAGMAFLTLLLLAANAAGAITATLGGGIKHPEIHTDGFSRIIHSVALIPAEREMLVEEGTADVAVAEEDAEAEDEDRGGRGRGRGRGGDD